MGNPNGTGPYIMRLKLPANYTFPPHTHTNTENVTIISGSVWFGLGKTMDKSKMKEFPAGTFASIPAKLPHYAMTKVETVIQLSGEAPYTVTMLK